MGQRRVHGDPPFAMAIEISPVPYSAPAQAELADTGFGAVVSGVNPNDLSANEFAEIEQLLYKHGVLVFKDAHMTPEGQYKLTKMFDPPADSYGHGAVGRPNNKSILHPDLRTIPSAQEPRRPHQGPLPRPPLRLDHACQEPPYRARHGDRRQGDVGRRLATVRGGARQDPAHGLEERGDW